MLSDADIQHFKQTILQLQKALLAVEQSGKESTRTVELDQTAVGRVSRMDALQGQAMAKEYIIAKHQN